MCTICLTSEARLLLTADEGIESEPTWKEFSLRHGEGISFSGVLIADGQDEIAVFLMSDHQEGVTHLRVLDEAAWAYFLPKYAEKLRKGFADYRDIISALELEAAEIYRSPPAPMHADDEA